MIHPDTQKDLHNLGTILHQMGYVVFWALVGSLSRVLYEIFKKLSVVEKKKDQLTGKALTALGFLSFLVAVTIGMIFFDGKPTYFILATVCSGLFAINIISFIILNFPKIARFLIKRFTGQNFPKDNDK